MQCSRNSRLIEAPRFWATPAALNAAGFPVGRKPAVRGDGTQTTTQRTLKRKAKRHIRCEAKRASRRGAREAGSAVGADFLGDAAAAEQPAFLGRLMLRRPAQRHQTRCCHRAALPLASLSTAITMDTTGIGMRMQPLPSLGCARCAPSGSAGGGASTSAATQV